jgi:DNA repair exonuclease SbcCD ATPase subunit
MIIKSITLNNFKNYEGTQKFEFSKYNLISGDNGTGKSTLGLDSILFCIYGFSTQHLENIPNKKLKNKKCSVTVEIDNLKITRHIPTSIEIIEDGVEIQFPTNREAQKYLNEKFNNVEYFKRFRMLDVVKGVNILEQGQTALIKTLSQYNQEIINRIRQKLVSIKQEKDRYNKDKAVIYSLYPSDKRYEFLKQELQKQENKYTETQLEVDNNNRTFYGLTSKKSLIDKDITTFTNQQSKLTQNNKCYTCNQNISQPQKELLNKELSEKIVALSAQRVELLEQINLAFRDVNKTKELTEKIKERLKLIETLLHKLEVRLKQKEYIYTEKDVQIVQHAISELDIFSKEYLVKWISTLEPLINNIINIIGFQARFVIDKKGYIEVKLIKDNVEYDYSDLSSGQKLLMTVGFQLALLLEKGESGIIIADEGFGSLSEDNLNSLIEMIKLYPLQLIYIIHRVNHVPEDVKEICL